MKSQVAITSNKHNTYRGSSVVVTCRADRFCRQLDSISEAPNTTVSGDSQRKVREDNGSWDGDNRFTNMLMYESLIQLHHHITHWLSHTFLPVSAMLIHPMEPQQRIC